MKRKERRKERETKGRMMMRYSGWPYVGVPGGDTLTLPMVTLGVFIDVAMRTLEV